MSQRSQRPQLNSFPGLLLLPFLVFGCFWSPTEAFSSLATSGILGRLRDGRLIQSSSSRKPHSSQPNGRTTRSRSSTFLWQGNSDRDDVTQSSSSSSTTPMTLGQQQRDVIIVGSGLAGLSAALYLKTQVDPSRHVTILERQPNSQETTTSNLASMAAAGMLAPHSERLPQGPLLDLCCASRSMYGDFVELVQGWAGQYHTDNMGSNSDCTDDDDVTVGYHATGGFLAPAFAGDAVATWAPPQHSSKDDNNQQQTAIWLDETQVLALEPQLNTQNLVGGWWFPQDASVDARKLTQSLHKACLAAGVQILNGPQYEVQSVDLRDGTCHGVYCGNQNKKSTTYMSCKTCLIANGAWMRNLLPVPMEPHKGQSLRFKVPNSLNNGQPLLQRVLFGQDVYIVPKATNDNQNNNNNNNDDTAQEIIVGATVEAGAFDKDVTAAGLLHILGHALQLLPGLAHLPIVETWVGLRPTTPDKGPLLGSTAPALADNLFVAGGYWRNGVLLAPKCGWLTAHALAGKQDGLSPEDRDLLKAFSWNRFLGMSSEDNNDGNDNNKASVLLAANTRYAQTMHPIHERKTPKFGTSPTFFPTTTSSASTTPSSAPASPQQQQDDLGMYATARAARQERARDRQALFSNENDGNSLDDRLEQAAALGKSDAAVYTGIERQVVSQSEENDASETESIANEEEDASARNDNGEVEDSDTESNQQEDNLQDIYASIRANKKKKQQDESSWAELLQDNKDSDDDDRPDPGFRIFHVDEETGQEREVPPYTAPGVFLEQIQKEKDAQQTQEQLDHNPNDDETPAAASEAVSPTTPPEPEQQQQQDDYNEQTFDGYTVIQNANSRTTREEELQAMRLARQQNRLEETEAGQIGVFGHWSPDEHDADDDNDSSDDSDGSNDSGNNNYNSNNHRINNNSAAAAP